MCRLLLLAAPPVALLLVLVGGVGSSPAPTLRVRPGSVDIASQLFPYQPIGATDAASAPEWIDPTETTAATTEAAGAPATGDVDTVPTQRPIAPSAAESPLALEPVAPPEPSAAEPPPAEPDEQVPAGSSPAASEVAPEAIPPPAPSSPVPATYAGSTASPTALTIGLEAMAMISYPWQQNLPGWRVEFHDAIPGYRGLTFPDERTIEIYVREDLGARATAEVIAHELGHAVDVDRLTDAGRGAWLRQRGLNPDHVWYPDAYASDFASGAGDWAEAFAVWQLGSSSRSSVGLQPGAADLALLARLAA